MAEIRCFGRIFFVSIFIFLNFLIIIRLKLKNFKHKINIYKIYKSKAHYLFNYPNDLKSLHDISDNYFYTPSINSNTNYDKYVHKDIVRLNFQF